MYSLKGEFFKGERVYSVVFEQLMCVDYRNRDDIDVLQITIIVCGLDERDIVGSESNA